ncbi:WD40 repeat-like protein [Guyanagaster necrorhizus]|uniref:WD40 repeat-like protein n=1 Tax=Guyanagaster necrorhizus TaxID=856835 RepID=A0A9P8AY86_9AGAR|nr:WD40 repeat-like protein [Guyanagaster necrorhizus MCA 3950]KAG7452210.1 WD40 repeat-like protein [Guyanagaster necrorhizus MCA 3950]
MTAPLPSNITIQADEINCLIYSYFLDCGFIHSAFNICQEGQLERSPNFKKHIPRGELAELLSKALFYTAIEAHIRGGEVAANCRARFSLLENHVCSPDPPQQVVTTLLVPTLLTPVVKESSTIAKPVENVQPTGKPKATPTPTFTSENAEKGLKRSEDMDIDRPTQSPEVDPSPMDSILTPITGKAINTESRYYEPDDEDGPPANAIRTMEGHKSEVFVCAFNPVKPYVLASGSKDATVNLWHVPEPIDDPRPNIPRSVVFTPKGGQGDLTSMHWNKDGTFLAVGSYDSLLRILTATGEIYATLEKHTDPIFTVRFSPSGRYLLSASLDGSSCLWDVKAKTLLREYRCHRDCVLDVEWINDVMFASCGADKNIHVLSVDDPMPIKSLTGHTNEINQIVVNASGTGLASCSDDKTGRLWNITNLSTDSIPGLGASDQVVILNGHKHAVTTMAWIEEKMSRVYVATGSFDCSTRLWDPDTGDCLKVFSDWRRPVYVITAAPGGPLFAAGGGDGWMNIYDVRDQEKKWSWYSGFDRPGIFDIDWQEYEKGKINHVAVSLESHRMVVFDVNRIDALNLY